MKYIEATLIMPMTILIVMALIGLMMSFYNSLGVQIDENNVAYAKLYEQRETDKIRIYDRLISNQSQKQADKFGNGDN